MARRGGVGLGGLERCRERKGGVGRRGGGKGIWGELGGLVRGVKVKKGVGRYGEGLEGVGRGGKGGGCKWGGVETRFIENKWLLFPVVYMQLAVTAIN